MNASLAKEIRPLILPALVIALAAAGYFLPRLNPALLHRDVFNLLIGLSGFAFAIGVLVLAALPMGLELNERTLSLLLSQPVDRKRLWMTKLAAATLSIVVVSLFHGVLSALAGQLTIFQFVLYAAFVGTAVCSVGYYTLAARSVTVGIATAVGTPWTIALLVHLLVYELLGVKVRLTEAETLLLGVGACFVYSVVFLWLGWRQFAALELRDTVASRGAEIPPALVPRQLACLIRSRPTGAIANVIRKEISLHKPVFLVTAIFAACWLVTIALMILHPPWQRNLETVLHGLTGAQVILMAFLTGCVALGDDKSLGTAAWHLILPISARTQWVIKLFVAFAMLVAMTLVVPALLAALTLFKAQVGILAIGKQGILTFTIICIVLFIISFWSASLTPNTIRAALTAIGALVGLASCITLSAWVSHVVFESGLQTGLVAKLLAPYNSLPTPISIGILKSKYAAAVVATVVIVVLLVALIQSAALFRHIQPGRRRIATSCFVLAATTFISASWGWDLAKSVQSLYYVDFEIGTSIAWLPDYQSRRATGETWQIDPDDLTQTGQLSEFTSDWLKNSSISVSLSLPEATAKIVRPNGELFYVNIPRARPLPGGKR